MEEEKSSGEKLARSISVLAEAYRNLISIRLVEHASTSISIGIIGILSGVSVVFVLLFTGLGAAWWLGEYFQDMKWGYFIVGGFYTLLFLTLLALSRKIMMPRIRDRIIKKIYEQD